MVAMAMIVRAMTRAKSQSGDSMEEAAGCTDEDALDCATEDAASEDCALLVTELDDSDAALLVAADDAVTDDDAFCDAVAADD